jgi:F-type H+-transporting ATPase subunit b
MEHETEAATAGAAHGEDVLAHADAGMPQLVVSIFPNLIFWLVVSIVLLYLIHTRVAIPRLSAVLAERSDAITGDLEEAQFLKRRAAEAEAAYEAALAKARDEAHKISAETREKIGKDLDALMAKADAEISARSKESEARIAEIRDNALASVEEVARDTAAESVAALMPGAADRAAVDAAVAGRVRG